MVVGTMSVMRARVCLQGGAEFSPGCEGMDAAMLSADPAATDDDSDNDGGARVRRVLVLPFAARPGRERDLAAGNARRWYSLLGAREVDAVLHEGDDVATALNEACRSATLVVLPGGSPQRLLEALAPHADLLRSAPEVGAAVSGASAGAMVLCRWSVLPGPRTRVVPALGVVEVDLVLPHYRAAQGGGKGWFRSARDVLPPNAVVLGLPERSAAILTPDGQWEPAGVERFSQLTAPD